MDHPRYRIEDEAGEVYRTSSNLQTCSNVEWLDNVTNKALRLPIEYRKYVQ